MKSYITEIQYPKQKINIGRTLLTKPQIFPNFHDFSDIINMCIIIHSFILWTNLCNQHHTQNTDGSNITHTHTHTHTKTVGPSLHISTPRSTLLLRALPVSVVMPECYRDGIMHYENFWGKPFTKDIMFLRYMILHVSIVNFFCSEMPLYQCTRIYLIFRFLKGIDRYLDCFHILGIVNAIIEPESVDVTWRSWFHFIWIFMQK